MLTILMRIVFHPSFLNSRAVFSNSSEFAGDIICSYTRRWLLVWSCGLKGSNFLASAGSMQSMSMLTRCKISSVTARCRRSRVRPTLSRKPVEPCCWLFNAAHICGGFWEEIRGLMFCKKRSRCARVGFIRILGSLY